jgi:hypothetical protein
MQYSNQEKKPTQYTHTGKMKFSENKSHNYNPYK